MLLLNDIISSLRKLLWVALKQQQLGLNKWMQRWNLKFIRSTWFNLLHIILYVLSLWDKLKYFSQFNLFYLQTGLCVGGSRPMWNQIVSFFCIFIPRVSHLSHHSQWMTSYCRTILWHLMSERYKTWEGETARHRKFWKEHQYTTRCSHSKVVYFLSLGKK